ncbi:hypothetical protein Pan161_34360 [Gimesia algae]|uniref:Uncharacterized protein n=1 Tax=Gimesia algae TaxID=2527971 RepID=A0A517VFI1_9PLAN|nr:hypothetical protein Pan161_34360 [Gimesia algae]
MKELGGDLDYIAGMFIFVLVIQYRCRQITADRSEPQQTIHSSSDLRETRDMPQGMLSTVELQ